MDNIKDLIKNLGLENNITLEDVPNIDLYMDQVIQLFESKFAGMKRNEDEKILTKTMINNYAKGKLFFPIKNKKYSKEHILLISLIYQMKGALSINDIKTLLEGINEEIIKETFHIEEFYQWYLTSAKLNVESFMKNVETKELEAQEAATSIADKDKDYLSKVLLAASFANMSNLFRRAAETIVDEITKEREEK